MKSLLSLLFLFTLVSACRAQKSDTVSYYYECERGDGFYIYSTEDVASQQIVYIPPYNKVYAKTVKDKQLIKVYYGNHQGYAINRDFKFKKTLYKIIPDSIVKEQEKFFLSWVNKSQLPAAQESTTQSSSSSSYNSGGSVNVKGYYRKSGTYVQPHTRRAPSRH
jgi:hypothetical protein